jgi:hypothetical protein
LVCHAIVGSETTDIYDVENHGYKKYNSLEMEDLRAFATHWTPGQPGNQVDTKS